MRARIGDVVIDRTYKKDGRLSIVVGEGISQPILLHHGSSITMDKLGDCFSTWEGLEVIGHINLEKIWAEAVAISTADTPQTDAEIPKNALRSDCTGCRFVGTYETEFPCANCVRKNKDYYSAGQTERSE